MKKNCFVLTFLFILMTTQALAANTILTPKLKDFTGIKVAGNWTVTVKKGNNYSIKLTVSNNIANAVVVNKSGDSLELYLNPQFGVSGGFMTTMKAEIICPQISSITSAGSSDISFSDFTSKNLELTAKGSGDIQGMNNKITNLTVNLFGSSDVKFSNSKTTNANVAIRGSGYVVLKMMGGNLISNIFGSGDITASGNINQLTGNIFGSGNINISGKVKNQRVDIKGSGNIEYR